MPYKSLLSLIISSEVQVLSNRNSLMAICYKDLPQALSSTFVSRLGKEAVFCSLSKDLIDSLTELFAGKKVLEIFAGRGHLSSLLFEKGVSIRATSLIMGHDQSDRLGHVFPVEEMDAITAVCTYHDEIDYVLVSWPVSDESLFKLLPYLPPGCPIVFIGEVTDYSVQPAFLGGCASDAFFEVVEENQELTSRLKYPTYRVDKIKVYQVKQN